MAVASPSSFHSVRILLFGAMKDAAGKSIIEIQTSKTVFSIAELLEEIGAQHSSLKKYLPHVRVAVNCEYSALGEEIKSDDEIALIPPVAGGCFMNDVRNPSKWGKL